MSDRDIVTALRQRHANATGIDPRSTTPILGPTIFSQAADEIERLRAERDEARREICERVSTTRWQPQFPLMPKGQYAEERGWDCFKEDGK